MKWQIIALIAGFVLLAIILKWLFFGGRKPSRYPYQRRSLLFSPDDRVFFRALQNAVGTEYEIFGKISVCDIIAPNKSASGMAAKNAFKPLEGRHFDFILCEKNSLSVACAVQLLDKTGQTRIEDEDPLIEICANLGLPLVNFPVMPEYSADNIRDNLRKALEREPLLLVETGGRKEPRISNLSDMNF